MMRPPTSTASLFASLALVAFSGCFFLGSSYESPGETYRKQFKKKQPLWDDYERDIMADRAKFVPVLGRDLVVNDPIPLKWSDTQEEKADYVLAKIDAQKICFGHEDVGASTKAIPQKVAEYWKKAYYDKYRTTFRFVTSLEAERGKPLFPWPAGSPEVTSLEVIGDEVRDFDSDRGAIERKRAIKFLLCAPRPETPADAKFLAILVHDGSEYFSQDFKATDERNTEDENREIDKQNQTEWKKKDALFLIAIE